MITLLTKDLSGETKLIPVTVRLCKGHGWYMAHWSDDQGPCSARCRKTARRGIYIDIDVGLEALNLGDAGDRYKAKHQKASSGVHVQGSSGGR